MNRNLTYRLLAILVFGLPLSGLAQSEAFWQTGQPLSTEASQIVFQKLQPGQVVNGSETAAAFRQVGGGNFASHQSAGPGHRTSMVQEGFGNQLVYNVRGSDTNVNLGQFGDNNQLILPDMQLQSAQLTIVQEGNGNGLYQQQGYAGQGVTLEIRQTGGMQIMIQNGPSGF